MSERNLIKLLKISISIGLCLLLLGIYLHNFNEYIESLGVTGIIISAICIALGLIFSLPTKMFLTFVLVKREAELRANEKASQLTPQDKTIKAVQKNSE
ncbi:MAG: vacuolar-type H+-ATPase subunit I/STV1 [Oleiphilaceae bacterium]|jgi:vacuolar-type H+-ATPase subunit I/STV1